MLSVVKKQLAQQRAQQQRRQQQQQQSSSTSTTSSASAPTPAAHNAANARSASSTATAASQQRTKRPRTSTTERKSRGKVVSIFDQARAAREQADYLSSNVAYLTRTSAKLQQIRQLHQRMAATSNKRRRIQPQSSQRDTAERDDYDDMNAGQDDED